MIRSEHFPKEHYSILFNPNTGFFARIPDKNHSDPLWSQHGPELIDISITNRCYRNCEICYRNSDKHGKHMSLSDYKIILDQAAQIGVLQVALGGGNPNLHPEFLDILKITREDYGIVPSYTTNGDNIDKRILEFSAQYCGAVAISIYEPYDNIESLIPLFHEYKIKTNIHFVLTSKSIKTILHWLNETPRFLENINALIFLTYKPVGRLRSNDLILQNIFDIQEMFRLLEVNEYPFRIGFDSCAVPFITNYSSINSIFYDACEASRFSMFISENLLMYPCSFMIHTNMGVKLNKRNLLETWLNGQFFQQTRRELFSNRCPNCKYQRNCLGGCPIFNELNICAPIEYSKIEV